MFVVYSPDHTLHAPAHEFLDGRLVPYFETPQRVEIIRKALEEAGIGPLMPPHSFGKEPLLAVHDAAYLAYLERAYERWVAAGCTSAGVMPSALPLRRLKSYSSSPKAEAGYYCFDLSAPIVAGTYAAARASADAALTGAALLLEGHPAVYALCRPPGHHAGRNMCGGYCYLNNAAIAANYLATVDQRPATSNQELIPDDATASLNTDDPYSSLAVDRSSVWAMRPAVVAILDIDIHHGNGTQEIFYERSDVLFVSIHADPAHEYPYFLGNANERGAGAGEGYNINLPLEAGADNRRFLTALDTALDQIRAYSPQYLVVSAGFDTFVDDPLGEFVLTGEVYTTIGARLAALGLPTLIVQEGGYAVTALGANVVRLLTGFMQGGN